MLRPEKKQRIRDYRFVFGSPEGKRVLEDLRSKAKLMDVSAVELDKTLTTNGMFFNEGRRSLVLYIYKMVTSDPYMEKPTLKESNDGIS